jgi:hypothetical protein
MHGFAPRGGAVFALPEGAKSRLFGLGSLPICHNCRKTSWRDKRIHSDVRALMVVREVPGILTREISPRSVGEAYTFALSGDKSLCDAGKMKLS